MNFSPTISSYRVSSQSICKLWESSVYLHLKHKKSFCSKVGPVVLDFSSDLLSKKALKLVTIQEDENAFKVKQQARLICFFKG